MNTHWNTVWSKRQSKGAFSVSPPQRGLTVSSVCWNSACCGSSSSTFPGLGFKSQSGQFFRFFSFFQLSATVNQWRIFFEEFYRLINMSNLFASRWIWLSTALRLKFNGYNVQLVHENRCNRKKQLPDGGFLRDKGQTTTRNSQKKKRLITFIGRNHQLPPLPFKASKCLDFLHFLSRPRNA